MLGQARRKKPSIGQGLREASSQCIFCLSEHGLGQALWKKPSVGVWQWRSLKSTHLCFAEHGLRQARAKETVCHGLEASSQHIFVLHFAILLECRKTIILINWRRALWLTESALESDSKLKIVMHKMPTTKANVNQFSLGTPPKMHFRLAKALWSKEINAF